MSHALGRNRQWALKAYPQGAATESSWALVDTEVPRPGPGQILIRTNWLSVDPYMRGRMSPPTSAGGGLKLGDVMIGGGVGEVVETNHPAWKVGDIAEALDVGWQDYAVLTPELPGAARVNRVDLSVAPAQAALHWMGMPGLTAYFGMLELGAPKPGDVVVVSAAAGAVGQIAGQIAKLAGCRVVGMAGSQAKLEWCRSIGFDDVIDYKAAASDLAASVAKSCPRGVNVFFDGTGGAVHDAVLKNLAIGARVAVVGKIAVADKAADEDIGIRASARLIATRARIQGLVVFDWWHRRDEALQKLVAWKNSSKLIVKEDIAEGLEATPAAFIRMMRGENLGKQLVKLT